MAQTSADISVVMPCYNGLPYIEQALESVLSQTLLPVEIIVVDDGSKDDSAAWVERFASARGSQLSGGIRLIRQANAGEPAARNTGIRQARGAWIAALDTDDWWEPTKLARQWAVAGDAGLGGGEDCVMVHTGVVAEWPDGRSERPDLGTTARRVGGGVDLVRALLSEGSIGHPSILVRKTALERIGLYDESYKQACDIDLYFRLSAVGRFAFVPEYLLHYRNHAAQMSGSQVKQIGFHHRAIWSFLENHPQVRQQIDVDAVRAALASHVAVKLKSLYWRRNLVGFRELLEYAAKQDLSNEAIERWRRKARWPDWVVRLKDRITGKPGT